MHPKLIPLLQNSSFLFKPGGKVIRACLLSISLVLVVSSSVFAYSLEGGRWYGEPTSGCCASINVQFYSMTAPDRTGYINGMVDWTLHSNVHLYVANGALTAGDTLEPGVSWDGITYYSINVFGYFNYAYTWLNTNYTQNYSPGTIKGVAAHELGHAIGLDHVNGCVLMTPSTSVRQACGITGPVRDDINGANALY